MPQVTIQGVPKNTSKKKLRRLRNQLIRVVESEMGISSKMTRVFFPKDELDDPDEGQDRLIWAFLHTGMFKGKPDSLAKKVTDAIAKTIFYAFDRTIDIEVFVQEGNAETKSLIRAD